ncbi:MAG TPA: hypothetical protein VIO14_03005 [Dehalococcoidia bacterium]
MELITQILVIGFLLAPVGVFYFTSLMAGPATVGRSGPLGILGAGVTLLLLLLAVEFLLLTPVMALLDAPERLFRDLFGLGLPGVYAQRPVAAAAATGLVTLVNAAVMAVLAVWDPLGRAWAWSRKVGG